MTSDSDNNSTNIDEIITTTMDILPLDVIVEISLFLTVTEVHRNMSLVCHRWNNIIVGGGNNNTNKDNGNGYDNNNDGYCKWRTICFREFGCEPILPKGRSWKDWIPQLKSLIALCIQTDLLDYQQQYNNDIQRRQTQRRRRHHQQQRQQQHFEEANNNFHFNNIHNGHDDDGDGDDNDNVIDGDNTDNNNDIDNDNDNNNFWNFHGWIPAPPRPVHSGNIVLPQDFHYHFKELYVKSIDKFQHDIQVHRLQLTRNLIQLANSTETTLNNNNGANSTSTADDDDFDDEDTLNDNGSRNSTNNNQQRQRKNYNYNHNHYRAMTDIVMNLRILASEQKELETTYIQYQEETMRERLRSIESNQKRQDTSKSVIILKRIRDELEIALKEGEGGDNSNNNNNSNKHNGNNSMSNKDLNIAEMADYYLLTLLPDDDMVGSDKARCKELRLVCREYVRKLRDRANTYS